MKYIVLSLLWIFCLPAMAQQKPNILLLMAEDMSSRVGAFGDPVAVTPNLDAFAKEGVRYTNTFTAAGVCAPSRAAHILGMHQISTGAQHMRTSTRPEGGYYAVPPAQVKAYPELLRAAGYYTYTDQKLDYQFSSPWPGSGPFTIWDDEGNASADWRGRAQGQPFFGFRNFPVTHESGVFRPIGEMPNSVIHFIMQVMRWWSMDEAVPPEVSPADVQLPPYYPDTPTVRADLARHYDNIAYMDAEVGAILAQLEADGLADSTIVIWTTDHGDGLPRAKRELYDSGLKVPMIIRWPEQYRPADLEPGTIDRRLISFIDFGPTILRLAGVAVPDYQQGQDFADTAIVPRQYIFASRDRIDEVSDRQRAIRDQRFKYIRSWQPEQEQGHPLAFRDNIDMVREMRAMYLAGQLNAVQSLWFQAPGEEQLYDLQDDPFEIYNLADNPAYEADKIRLRTALDQRLAEVGDWSDESESAMVLRFELDGERRITPAPAAAVSDGLLILEATAVGSSLGYRLNEGDWKLYSYPVAIGAAEKIEAKAVRYGWEESEVTSVAR
jgi:N-sulfoglucosamine sulfohydrolase